MASLLDLSGGPIELSSIVRWGDAVVAADATPDSASFSNENDNSTGKQEEAAHAVAATSSTASAATASASASSDNSAARFPIDQNLNSKIAVWKGKMWRLATDTIVNSTNEALTLRDGIAGEIWDIAGKAK